MKKLLYLFLLVAFRVSAQSTPPPVTFTAEQDHKNMMDQLGINALRPGPSGNENDPDHANYDELKANPCPILPEILMLKNGKKVTTPDTWWKMRRPEIVKGLENEMYGRLPKDIPAVKWEIKYIDHEYVGFTPVIAKQLIGHVDNSACPSISVDIEMTVVIPANAKGPVPLLMMFGQAHVPSPSQPNPTEVNDLNTALQKILIAQNPGLKKIFEKHPAYQLVTATNPFAAFWYRTRLQGR